MALSHGVLCGARIASIQVFKGRDIEKVFHIQWFHSSWETKMQLLFEHRWNCGWQTCLTYKFQQKKAMEEPVCLALLHVTGSFSLRKQCGREGWSPSFPHNALHLGAETSPPVLGNESFLIYVYMILVRDLHMGVTSHIMFSWALKWQATRFPAQ